MKKLEINKDALDFESSLAYMVESSNKKAWFITIVSVIIALISVVAVSLLTPLKTVEPYVIRVDNTTGMVDIITTLNEEQISSNEALDKHFIAEYVKKREGYVYEFLNEDYKFVQLLSNSQVAQKYREIYAGAESRDTLLKNNYRVDVDILSIVLGDSNGQKIATVRANLKTLNKNSNDTTVQTIVITLAYDYFLAEMSEENRLSNPLGFKVVAYRIDEEIKR